MDEKITPVTGPISGPSGQTLDNTKKVSTQDVMSAITGAGAVAASIINAANGTKTPADTKNETNDTPPAPANNNKAWMIGGVALVALVVLFLIFNKSKNGRSNSSTKA